MTAARKRTPSSFSDADGIRAAELEEEYAELGGWEAESDAGRLLQGLGIHTSLHTKQMSELEGRQKVKVLLAQALFGHPDIILLDEPTNHLDLESIAALNNGMTAFPFNIIFYSHDHQLTQTVANRIIELTEDGCVDRMCTYDEYMHAMGRDTNEKEDQS